MSYHLDWARLLSSERHVGGISPDRGTATQDERTSFERDYDRIIFSAPFRRLARKTQVHPFAEMDQIHNRLTHTLEVASVGRSLGYALGRFIQRRGELPDGRTVEDLVCIVQAACLAHDIGNPPFGHAGEFAIREWVRDHRAKIFGAEIAPAWQGIAQDWSCFEGNAQSFRMVARADNREQIYIRFTYASLGAMTKYPWGSLDPRAESLGKFNFFTSEEGIFQDMVDSLGLRRLDGEVVRHPLSYLTEAADDICYQIGDFEDAVQMRILTEAEVRNLFSRIIGETDDRPLPALRAKAIGCLVRAAHGAMENNYAAIMAGERRWDRTLKHDFPAPLQEALQEMKNRYPYIFSHRPKIAAELGAYQSLGQILSAYIGVIQALTQKRSYNQLSFIQKRHIELAWPESYARAHETDTYEWWLSRLMDFIAGMTDNYAVQVAREMGGV